MWGQRVWIEPDGGTNFQFVKDGIRFETVDPVRNQLYNQTTCPEQGYFFKRWEFEDPCPFHVTLGGREGDGEEAGAVNVQGGKRDR